MYHSIDFCKKTWSSIGLLLTFSLLFGQKDSSFKAWLETQSIDGKTVITGWCQNNTVSPVHLKYKAVLLKDTTMTIRENSTMSMPGQPTMLLKTVFVIADGIFEKIRLEVYRQQELVAFSEIAGAPPPSPEQRQLLDNLSGEQPAAPLPEALEIVG